MPGTDGVIFTGEVSPVIIRYADLNDFSLNQGGLTSALTAILSSTMNTRPEAPEDFPVLPALQKLVETLCTWHGDAVKWQA
jgi:hypothetical protein